MDNKYSINRDKNGRITWVKVENVNGEVEIKQIKNVEDASEYMKSLQKINKDYNDFFLKIASNDYEDQKAKTLEKERKRILNENYKEKKRAIKEKNPSRFSLRKKAAAGVVAAALALSAIPGVNFAKSLFKNNQGTNVYAEEDKDQKANVNEENKELKAIYEKILAYEDGEEIVKHLQLIDQDQKAKNEILAKYPDSDGNVLFYKAEEVAARHAIGNGTDMKVPLLLPANLVICPYLEAATISTMGMAAMGDVNEWETLLFNDDVKKEYMSLVNPMKKLFKGEQGAEKEVEASFAKLFETPETYPEATSYAAYDGMLANAEFLGAISSDKVKEYQEITKTNNAILNYVMKYIETKEELTKNSKDIYKLALEAYDIMDKKNIKTDLKSRDRYDVSTTERFKQMHELIFSGSGEGSLIVTSKTKTKTVTRKISRAEAKRIFGEAAVEKAEKEAEANQKVDTNGDGKPDKTIPEANKDGDKKKEELQEQARNYEKDFALGQKDALAGKSKQKNTSGYNAGYAQGLKMKEAAKEEEIVKKEETFTPEPTKQAEPAQPSKPAESTKPSTSQDSSDDVVSKEEYWEPAEPTNINEPVKSESNRQKVTEIKSLDKIEIQIDGTTYESGIQRVRS